jgi:TfoX/Sxy family transcriptional regulator of competence genes
MTFSQSLAERVRLALQTHRSVTEKKLFGGVGFMLKGNIMVGVWKSSLIVRLGPDQAAVALKKAHVREFDITGRPMKGWIMVDLEGLETDRKLVGWIERATWFVETLPGK